MTNLAAERRRKLSSLLIGLFLFATPAILLWDFLLFRSVFYYFDFEIQWIPLHQFIHAAMTEGQSFLWNPYVMLGFPQHAESQGGAFYPLTWLLHFLENQDYAINLALYLHMVIGTCSTYVFARALQLDRMPALLATVCFAFSGMFFAQFNCYNIPLATVYLPLKLFLLTRYSQTDNIRYLFVFSLALGMELLISHTNTTFITTAGVSAYFALLTLLQRRLILKHFACYVLAIVMAALLASVQIFPTYELMTQSWRSGGLSYEAATSWSTSFSQYLTAFFPMMYGAQSIGYRGVDFFEEVYFYIGTFGILLSCIGVTSLVRRRDNLPLLIMAVLALLALIVSLGNNNPFFELHRLLIHIPGFNFFRVPARWGVIVAMGLSLLAAYGLQTFVRMLRAEENGRLAIVLVLAALIAPSAIFILGWFDEPARSTMVAYITNPVPAPYLDNLSGIDKAIYRTLTSISPVYLYIFVVGILLLLITANRFRVPLRYCAPLIVGLAFIDMLCIDRPMNLRANSDFYKNTPMHIRDLQEGAGNNRVISTHEIPNMESVNNYMGAFYQLQTINGYAPIKIRNYMSLEPYLNDRWMQDFLGTRYEIVYSETGNLEVRERPEAFPRAFVLERYRIADNEQSAFDAFISLSQDERKSVAIISSETAARFGLAEQDGGQEYYDHLIGAGITHYENSRLTIEGFANRPGFLLLTDIHYPGWRARLNDNEVPVVPIHGVLRGVYLSETGHFRVEMNYNPASFRQGLARSVFALLLFFVGGVYLFRPRFRRESRQRFGINLLSARFIKSRFESAS